MAVLLFIVGFSIQAQSAIWRVGPALQLKTIHAALEKSSKGDTIIVTSGLYQEGNIRIGKSVVIIGEGESTVDGQNKFEVFTIESNNVTIRNLKITNTGVSSLSDLAAIGAENVRGLYISNNVIDNAFFGIHLANCKTSTVENNILTSRSIDELHTGNGIHLWKCQSITINNNKITKHRDGIYLEFVTDSFITNNVSEDNLRYGLHFMFSHNDEYSGNTFKNNGAGIAVMYSRGVKMFRNHFMENWGSTAFGLLLKEISESRIERNVFYKNTVAIYLEGCSRSHFSLNEFRENGFALKLQANCDDNVFEKNNFIANSFDLGTNGSMTLNTINKNYWDKYSGYDLNGDGLGDVPFHPVSMYAMIVEKMPTSIMLWRSFLVFLLDRTEKVIPVVTPENLRDDVPVMTSYDINS
ncbi:MAG: nitrous oxide reductase family maturation protein NosD [Cyclobacteriaceae bacterium]|nr:nitrous oxide reductase family maturation protein NosD [Cyclobacteriaceae bacterium]